MKSRDTWRRQMKQLAKDLTNLTAIANTNDVKDTELDMDALKDNRGLREKTSNKDCSY